MSKSKSSSVPEVHECKNGTIVIRGLPKGDVHRVIDVARGVYPQQPVVQFIQAPLPLCSNSQALGFPPRYGKHEF